MVHDHGHSHGRRLGSDRRALGGALGLVLAFAAVEVAGGIAAHSLALIADAGHMVTDAASLGLALVAVWLAGRPATPQRSFGWRRAEILAALANGAGLVALALWIFIEAARRLSSPADVRGGWVLGIGLAGLAVNVAAAGVLRRAGRGSLNVRAALRHVLADLASSLGVIAAATVVLATGWQRIDPLISIGIGALVLASSAGVLRESLAVLLESTPAGMSAEEVGGAMAMYPGVVEVHDLHIWTITSGFPALSAHVLVEAGADCHRIRLELDGMLREHFGLDHTTLQVEHRAGLVTLGR